MRTYNKSNTQNVKKARKQSKELRKLKMANGSTITFIGETDEAFKGLQHSYHYEDDYNTYEGGVLMQDSQKLEFLEDADLMHSDQMTNEDVQNETTIISGYSSFLAEVNDLAKLNKSSGEQLVTQVENDPLRKIPKLSDNKKFLGHLRATRLLIYKN